MGEENKKIVIVIGAGASSDFALLNEIQFDQNYGKIKYEISDNLKYKTHHEQAGNLYNPDPRRYFLTEKKGNNYAFPSGQALINLMCNENKVASFFWKEIVEEFRKSNLEKEQIRNDATFSQLHQKFCDFLLEHHELNSKPKITELTYSQVLSSFVSYIKNQAYNPALSSFYSDKILSDEFIERNLNHLYLNSSQNSNQANSPFYKIILHNCSSRYILISKLVRYYQPFSIDELLDSIKKDKIDYLAPLNLDLNKLKKILPNSNEKQKEDLKNEFRKNLIEAGKTLIALFLMRSEKRELFENDSYDVDSKIWYRHIRNLIISTKNPEETIKNLTIISFNYDRSLDYYLRTRLLNYYDKIKERKSLYSSNKIFVLGFAFHRQNCDLLQLDKLENKKEIFYTNFDSSIGVDRLASNLPLKKFSHRLKKGVYDALIHDFRLDSE